MLSDGLYSYIGSLFSIRGPRDTTALLDIERAFNKLEKVALARRKKGTTPLILIINSTHLVRDDHDGQDLLEMIQQRAEQWAASGLVTTSKFPSIAITECHRYLFSNSSQQR